MNTISTLQNDILNICISIKNKVNKLTNSTNKLKLFNAKLEAYLLSIGTYTLDISNNTNIKNNIKNINNTNIKNNINTDILFSNENKKVKIASKLLYNVLQEKKSVMLDELVKIAKLSKYKTISILGILVKEGIVTKKFNKGFIYEMV